MSMSGQFYFILLFLTEVVLVTTTGDEAMKMNLEMSSLVLFLFLILRSVVKYIIKRVILGCKGGHGCCCNIYCKV